jgi:(1->4)-alpha-D-glucan 1-alpha-D-glucosylmutase
VSTDRTARRPLSTYRVQLHAGFTFDDAASLAGYLRDLGVSHLYCSPVLQAAPGSTHGYDVVDHSRLSDALGGRAAFDRLSSALREAGIGCVVDVVPNHMDVGSAADAQWRDVLRNGEASPYAAWFDIDWSAHGGRVLLPVLGDDLESVLARGELSVDDTGDEPVISYYEHSFPLAAGTASGSVADVVHRQHYLLAGWREAATSLNYRRFFDVTTLGGVRVEDPAVYDATHAVVLDLMRDGLVDGLRIDHPDGLADPAGYFRRLHDDTGGAWVVVEKILEPGEPLRTGWPVAGTSGYDALVGVGGVFVDPTGERPLTELYAEITGQPTDWAELVHAGKLGALDRLLGAELDWLVRVARRDHEPLRAVGAGLRGALRELLAAFPVYRTYLRAGEEVDDADRRLLGEAGEDAVRRRPDLRAAIEAVVTVLADVSTVSELRTRFQQTTGPVTAKGVEDTAFYRYHRLVSLNEVGGDPGHFGMTVDEFHAAAVRTQREWPLTMTTLSTHDTKRSEDVRARIALLAQCTGDWAAAVRRWVAGNERHWGDLEPDRNLEYLLYQTLVGAWPLTVERAVGYAEKASREAKQRTSWTDPDDAYDSGVRRFVEGLFADSSFQRELADFARPLVEPGRVASLAQKLVQLTMPGVPDVYQGNELWDLSLVDPDNRRPVDYAVRAALLTELDALGAGEVLARSDEGLPKLLVTTRALALRRRLPEAFGPAGAYQPLRVSGPSADRALAFSRAGAVVTVVPRLAAGRQ